MDESAAQYFGSWDGKRERALYDLAKEYHDRCEAYDRTICTGPVTKDGIMPRTYSESYLIGKNARLIRQQVIELGLKLGLKEEEIDRAIAKYSQDGEGNRG